MVAFLYYLWYNHYYDTIMGIVCILEKDKITKKVVMLKIATVFSGIGAVEQALKQLNTPYKILFACDNGERYLKLSFDDINKMVEGCSKDERENIVRKLYDSTNKENLVKKSYIANYGDNLEDWYEDIRFLDGSEYKGELDLLVGGSPCQSFSTYGKKLGLEDVRGTLFYDYARLIKESQPKVFIYENVAGMLTHDHGHTWQVIQDVFRSLNYSICYEVLNAQDYGLPQMRKRLFVIGVRNDLDFKIQFPPKKIKLECTAEDYLEKNVDNKYYLPYKGFRYVTESERNEGRARVNRDIIGCQTANQQFNWTGDFRIEEPQQRHYDDKRIYIGNYKGHPAVARKLTPRECLNLMGFGEFKILVPDQVMYRQAGNSIAVPVLKNILTNILEALDGEMVY